MMIRKHKHHANNRVFVLPDHHLTRHAGRGRRAGSPLLFPRVFGFLYFSSAIFLL